MEQKPVTNSLKKGQFAPPDYLKLPITPEPGYTYRWIKVDEATGLYGGQDARSWEVVRKGAGSSDPYRKGDLMLARMPNDIVQDRNSYYQERSNAAVEMIQNPERYLTEQEKFKHGKHFKSSVQIQHGRR